MKNQDIRNFDQRLAEQIKAQWENYVVKRIDLSIARTDEPLNLAGEFLYIERASSADANATVKLNRNTNDPLFLQEDVTLETLFGILFLSNEAQADEWIDLIVGANFAYKKKHKLTGHGNRGDPANYDYDKTTLTQDNAWHELDLSGIVPAGVKTIRFFALIRASTVAKAFFLRKAGNVNDQNRSQLFTQAANLYISADWEIDVDADRKVEYKLSIPAWIAIYLIVKGWGF